jgi:tol-pal system protein YbgF
MRISAFTAGWIVCFGVAGCSGGHDAAEKELAEMRAALVKVRADQAVLSERIDAMELGRTSGTKGAKPISDQPNLDVVRLGPDPSEDPNADTPRTVIKATGRVTSVEEAGGSAKSQGPERDLEAAMDLFKNKKIDKALDAFAGFLVRYPDHPSAEAAAFYRGECYAAKNDPRRAIEQFEIVASNYPKGTKAPDALLRVAQSYAKLGDKGGSDQAKKRLVATYPDSAAAQKLAPGKKP